MDENQKRKETLSLRKHTMSDTVTRIRTPIFHFVCVRVFNDLSFRLSIKKYDMILSNLVRFNLD
jgi:hypothetical protein